MPLDLLWLNKGRDSSTLHSTSGLQSRVQGCTVKSAILADVLKVFRCRVTTDGDGPGVSKDTWMVDLIAEFNFLQIFLGETHMG